MYRALGLVACLILIGNQASAFEGQITGTVAQKSGSIGPELAVALKVKDSTDIFKSEGIVSRKYVIEVSKQQDGVTYPMLRYSQLQSKLKAAAIFKADNKSLVEVRTPVESFDYVTYDTVFIFENLNVKGQFRCSSNTKLAKCQLQLKVTSSAAPTEQEISGMLEYIPTAAAFNIPYFKVD